MLDRSFPRQFDNVPTAEPGDNKCVPAEARE
jgi:hypothetical protein